MSVTQTVEIPPSHRLVLDVPREVPAGKVILTFTPPASRYAAGEELWGLAARMGSTLTAERFNEILCEDTGREAAAPAADAEYLQRKAREARDIELINLHADELNAEMSDVLLDQIDL